jgi:ferredoxin
MAFSVEVNRGKCIGCLACTRCHNCVCGNDFKAQTVRSEVEAIGCNQEAAAICPVGAISISAPNPNPDKPEPKKIN